MLAMKLHMTRVCIGKIPLLRVTLPYVGVKLVKTSFAAFRWSSTAATKSSCRLRISKPIKVTMLGACGLSPKFIIRLTRVIII